VLKPRNPFRSRQRAAGPEGRRPVIAPYHEIDVVSWHPADGSRNFGDHLSRIVVESVAREHGRTLDDEVASPRRLLAIGSSLHFARDGDTVWGCGINGKIPTERITARRLDIRAVRGPKTAAILRELGLAVPDIYGDPALLLPRYFRGRFPLTGMLDYVVVPNFHDVALIAESERKVSPKWGWNRCIAAIVSARFVVASSLHALIVAEAFGIPARQLRLSDTESQFKYDDYAQGTGRLSLTPARSIEQALEMGGEPPPCFDERSLLAAFPIELWD